MVPSMHFSLIIQVTGAAVDLRILPHNLVSFVLSQNQSRTVVVSILMHRNGKAHYLGYMAAQTIEESAKVEERWLFFRLCVCGLAVS